MMLGVAMGGHYVIQNGERSWQYHLDRHLTHHVQRSNGAGWAFANHRLTSTTSFTTVACLACNASITAQHGALMRKKATTSAASSSATSFPQGNSQVQGELISEDMVVDGYLSELTSEAIRDFLFSTDTEAYSGSGTCTQDLGWDNVKDYPDGQDEIDNAYHFWAVEHGLRQ